MVRIELMLKRCMDGIARETFNLRRALKRREGAATLYHNMLNPSNPRLPKAAAATATNALDQIGAIDRSNVPVVDIHQEEDIDGAVIEDSEEQVEAIDQVIGDSVIKSDATHARDETYNHHVDASEVPINSA